MADNDKEGILEDAEENEAQTDIEVSKKGLSTALLIKIAIGLAVLLIVLAVSLFFFTGKESDEPADMAENNDIEQVTAIEANQTEQIELPAIAEQASQSATMDSQTTTDNSVTTTATPNDSFASSEKVLAQIIALQEQISSLQKEKAELSEQVEALSQENADLKKEVEIFSQAKTQAEIPLDQLVNDRELPRDYRRDQYANTPQFELKPKWGEFDSVNKK